MYAILNGIRMAYDDQGEGVAVLLIHGYPLSRAIFAPQERALSPHYRVIVPDLRGFGDSDAPGETYHMALLADDLVALLDHLGVNQAVVGGLSMGGYVALAFWRHHAPRVRALILMDTRAEADTDEVRQSRQQAIATAWQEGSRAIAEQMAAQVLGRTTHASRPALVEEVKQLMASTPPAGIIGALQGMLARPAATDLLPAISVPTLVLVGEEDAEGFQTAAQTLAERIPGARRVTIPQAGHLITLENPSAVNAALLDFLASLPPLP